MRAGTRFERKNLQGMMKTVIFDMVVDTVLPLGFFALSLILFLARRLELVWAVTLCRAPNT